MIITHRENGGWAIEVVNGDQHTRFECTDYLLDHGGVYWFDFDVAMRDAEALDAAQNSKGGNGLEVM